MKTRLAVAGIGLALLLSGTMKAQDQGGLVPRGGGFWIVESGAVADYQAQHSEKHSYDLMKRRMLEQQIQQKALFIQERRQKLEQRQAQMHFRQPEQQEAQANLDSSHQYLGQFSINKLAQYSTGNPLGVYGSSLSPKSINNVTGEYGNPLSPHSVNNPMAIDTPKLYDSKGRYAGKLSSNAFDPESIGNALGIYGNTLSAGSIHNPLGLGNPLNPDSPFNEFGAGLTIIAPKTNGIPSLNPCIIDPHCIFRTSPYSLHTPVYEGFAAL